MSTHPRSTAALLISLAVIAGAAGWLYQRHTWCRYLCPLGAMCAAFSAGAAMRIRARKEVCQAVCTGNECYKGSDRAKPCPMFNHVMFLSNGQHCKLCLECIRSCPSQAPRLVLQLPLRDIWRSTLISTDAAPVTVVVGLMALLLAATPLLNARSQFSDVWFALGAVTAVALGLAFSRFLRQTEDTEDTAGALRTARIAYAYAFSVAATLFAFHLSLMPGMDEIYLRIAAMNVELLKVSMLHAVQAAAIGLGGVMTLWTLWRLCRQGPDLPFSRPVQAFALLGSAAVAYLVGGLALLVSH